MFTLKLRQSVLLLSEFGGKNAVSKRGILAFLLTTKERSLVKIWDRA